jgi:hypothetical protein
MNSRRSEIMKLNVTMLLLAGVIAGSQMGCDKGEQAAPATSGSAAAAPKKTDEAAPKEAVKAAPKATSIPVTDFLAKLAPNACTWIDQCKNEKIKAVAATMGMMIAGFGSMDKPDLAAKVKTVGDAMKADKRALPNKQECETVGGVVLQLGGMTPDIVQGKVGKTVQYDGEKAAACFAALEGAFAPCATEVKLTGEPKLSEIETFQKEFDKDLDVQMKACDGVFTGMIEAGQACEYEFECKGESSDCKGAAGAKKCEAGKKDKK